MSDSVDLTLLVCTFNRSDDLNELLASAVAQITDGSFSYEVLVVDNNSTDSTREVVSSYIAAGHSNVRYLFEGRQGKSHALNTGLAAAAGSIYAITDDDFILPPEWVKKIIHGFRNYPDASFVSGKVLPLWRAPIPTWVSQKHWSALALADYGDEVFVANGDRQVCLLACSFKKSDVVAVGGYDTNLSVSGTAIGGVEDLEILQRLWHAGRKGVYLPDLSFSHKVQPDRLTKRYHRKWHRGHGRFYSRLRDPDFERSRARLFGVPLHVYRLALRSVWQCVWATVARKPTDAFDSEIGFQFAAGYIFARWRSPNIHS